MLSYSSSSSRDRVRVLPSGCSRVVAVVQREVLVAVLVMQMTGLQARSRGGLALVVLARGHQMVLVVAAGWHVEGLVSMACVRGS